MKHLQTTILINTSPERVWQVLTDFAAYPEWNPFIRQISGKPLPGETLEILLGAPGTKPMLIRPEVLKAEKNHYFQWLGQMGFKGLFGGAHYFQLEAVSAHQTRFVHGEHFSGILRIPLMAFIGKSTRMGFEAMNEALKKRAEAPQHA